MMLFNQAGPSPVSMPATATAMEGYDAPTTPYAANAHQQQRMRRKRKADAQDANNERLSKRMSLLNLEHNGPKLYVPVEQPHQPRIQQQQQQQQQQLALLDPVVPNNATPILEEEPMQLDDTKHKVYIYNLDDELASENESEPEDREGRLVFLPDIERHLRANRIIPHVPRPILPNQDGELAGMQLVLYSDGPSSISVPEEHDSVRKAIIDARARVRQRQAEERAAATAESGGRSSAGTVSFATPVKFPRAAETAADTWFNQTVGQPSSAGAGAGVGVSIVPDDAMDADYDPDAMDID